MRTYKMLFWITLISGIIILSIGIYLQSAKILSSHIFLSRFGEFYEGRITGFGGILIGIFVILLSIYIKKCAKEEKDKFDKLD